MKREQRVMLVKLDKPPGGIQHLSFSEPIGLCYLAAILKRNHIECCIVHVANQFEGNKQEILERLSEYKPDIVGFSVRNFNFKQTSDIIQIIRNKYRDIRIVLGGEVITTESAIDLASNTHADMAVIGDGEHSFLDYVKGKNPQNIPNIIYNDGTGNYITTPRTPEFIDVAELPMMCRDGLPMDKYTSELFKKRKYATMHVQRGCRYRCSFCTTSSRYSCPGVTSRTIDQILDEIKHLVDHYDVDSISIFDEDFFALPGRVELIANELIQQNIKISWQTYMNIKDLKAAKIRHLLPLLKESGYTRAFIGLESFIPKTMKRYNKSVNHQTEELLHKLTDNGIILCPTYIIGEPHETMDEVQYGLDRLLAMRDQFGILIDFPYVSFITPFFGTKIYDDYKSNGLIIDEDISHYDGEHVVVKSKCSTDDLLRLRDNFYQMFYDDEHARG